VLIADNLSADTIIPTLLHELGGHGGFQNMMNQKQYDELMNQFNKLVEQGNPIAIEAKKLAEREQGSERQQLEYLPYLLTLASNTKIKNAIHKGNVKRLISDLIAQVKAWIYDRLGVNINLNPNDMVALAERMVDKAATNVAVNRNGHTQYSLNENNQPLYSRVDLSGSINRLSKSFKQASAQSTNQWLKNKAKDTLGIALQALSRRQIMDVYGKLLPQLHRYNHIVELMDADATETSVNADNIVNEWADLKDEQQLAELMHEATLAKIDPAKPFVSGSGTSISKYAQLRKAYDALTPEAQAMYVKARDAYTKHYADVHQAIKERILRSELSNQKKTDLLKQMDDNFFAQSKGVYFPLSRFGKYVVVVRDANGVVESVNRAETLNEAEAVRIELQKQFPNSEVSTVTKDKEFNASRDGVGRGFMSELFKEAGNLGLSAKDQADFEDTLSQLYLASMPDLSWAKHGIHRKGMAGFSQDARRAFAQNMFHGGSYLAKLRYGDQLAEQLDSMKKTVEKEIDKNPDYDQVTARSVYEEMEKRHESYMNPKPHPVSTALTSLGFVYYLGISPAAAMVNLSQTALVAYPMMGAKFGFKKSAAALKAAMADFAKGVDVKNRNLDITKSLNTDEKKAYEEALRRGVIDKTQVHSLAGVAQGEDSGLSEKLKPIMKWSSFMFHHAERFNREVTFVAAYRLAKEHTKVENGKPRKLTNDEALEMAIDMTYKGHFDYSAGNRARFMQGNFAKVVLLFKQFAQNMIFTLMRQAYLSMYGMDVNERKEARKALTAILAFHGMAAGLLGLPIATSLVAASFLIAKKNPMLGMLFGAGAAAVFFGAGGDDDDPWDLEVEIRNYAAEVLGDDAANYLFKGAPRALGIDLSGRVGLDNLVIPKYQEGLEGQNLSNSVMAGALGPVAGIGANLFKGGQELGDGNLGRAMEAMLPVFMKNPIKAIRYADEGVQDKTGISIQDEVDAWGLFNQTIGFSPADVRLAYEGRSAIYQKKNRLTERRGELMSMWSRARKQDDQEEMDAIWEEIQAFNEINPKIRINRMQLMQSYRQRENRVNKSEDGIYVTRKYEDSREAGAFAFRE
ncbi:MAG: PLxRFG domain-containing protein, partial [Acinetobacter sp.]